MANGWLTTTPNPRVSPTVRVFAITILIVLLGGMQLLLAPHLIAGRWPWPLAPYAARFLGAIYLTEFVALAIVVVVNRWAPVRLMLTMALVFTLVVTVASALNLDRYDLARRATLGWFVLYAGSAASAAALLWQHRHLPVPAEPVAPIWRLLFLLQGLLLAGYGVVMLVAPQLATAWWPWPADMFTGRVYSGMFLAAGTGALMLSIRSVAIDRLAFAATQVTLGASALVGAFLASAPTAYARPDLLPWIAGCSGLVMAGLVAAASSLPSPGSRNAEFVEPPAP